MSPAKVKRIPPQKFRVRYRNRLWAAFILALGLAVLAQWTFTPHPYFAYDGEYWFYPLFGLVSSIVLVVFTKLLGFVLKRRETYWQEKG